MYIFPSELTWKYLAPTCKARQSSWFIWWTPFIMKRVRIQHSLGTRLNTTRHRTYPASCERVVPPLSFPPLSLKITILLEALTGFFFLSSRLFNNLAKVGRSWWTTPYITRGADHYSIKRREKEKKMEGTRMHNADTYVYIYIYSIYHSYTRVERHGRNRFGDCAAPADEIKKKETGKVLAAVSWLCAAPRALLGITYQKEKKMNWD